MDLEHNPTKPRQALSRLRYADAIVVAVAAPIALVSGAPALGYGVGAMAWMLLRGVGVAVDLRANTFSHVIEQVALRLGYRLTRIVLLALATIVAKQSAGNDDGLTALLVILVAFTIQLAVTVAAWAAPEDRRGGAVA
jgi:hypothetical protein